MHDLTLLVNISAALAAALLGGLLARLGESSSSRPSFLEIQLTGLVVEGE
jgi:hypothetical protein